MTSNPLHLRIHTKMLASESVREVVLRPRMVTSVRLVTSVRGSSEVPSEKSPFAVTSVRLVTSVRGYSVVPSEKSPFAVTSVRLVLMR